MGTLLPDFPDVEELKLPEDIESGKVGHSALGLLHGKIIIIIILLPQNVLYYNSIAFVLVFLVL